MAEQRKDSPRSPLQGDPEEEHRRRRAVRIVLLSLASLLLLGVGFAGFAYWKLNSNIQSVDVDSLLGRARPPAATDGSFNLLLLGSDSREGANRKLAGGAADGTARSDTAMVVHVEKDHKHASVVSIPRDTLIDRPQCTRADGTVVPAQSGVMFNSAFEAAGAPCAVKTVESMTGMRMDHFIEIDFAGFADFIDAIGGVTVTTTVGIDDRDSGLKLPKGTHHLGGDQALAFVRTRHGVGDGSDLGRIELQQQMVKSIVGQAEHIGLLADPVQVFKVGDTLTRSITADSALASVDSLVGLAETLKDIGPGDLTTVTMPVHYAPSDPNRVVTTEPQAGQLWAALRDDQPVPVSVQRPRVAGPE